MVRMTWSEILRRRVLIITLIMTMVFLALYTFAVKTAVSRQANLTGTSQLDLLTTYLHGMLWLSIGLYLSNFTVAYLTIFSSAGTISSEVENGLLLAILPRPLPRWKVYLGKWLGYALFTLLYGAVMFCAIVWIVHSFDDLHLLFGGLWRAFLVFELIPITLVTLSVFCSLYLPALGNGVMLTLLVGLAMLGGFVQHIPSQSLHTGTVGLVTSLLLPTNADYYRVVYELVGQNTLASASSQFTDTLGPFGGGTVPSTAFIVYSVIYTLCFLLLGVWRFSRKDI